MATISELKENVETHLGLTISDSSAIKAYNEFSIIVRRHLQRRYNYDRKYIQTQVGSSGLDLSTVITDARDYNVGFEVYLGDDVTDLDTQYKLNRIHPGIRSQPGYFIMNNTLYLKNLNGSPGKISGTEDVIIFYNGKRTAISDTSATFEFDQDLEPAFERYLEAIFFDGGFRPENVSKAINQLQDWLRIFIIEPTTS